MSTWVAARLLEESPIVISGMGGVCAAGLDAAALWEAAVNGRASGSLGSFEFGGAVHRLPVCRVSIDERGDPRWPDVRRSDRAVQLAWWAAREALGQAGVPAGSPLAARMGILVGSSRGPVGKSAQGVASLALRRFPPSLSPESTFGVLAGAVARQFGIRGPSATLSASCASAALAIGLAAEQILLGKADLMLAGGTEAPLVPAVLAPLHSAGILGFHADPTRACRPFDSSRNGLCPGEGAAFLVLESAASAARRGVSPLARLSGWGTGVDDSGRTGVEESGAGLEEVVTQALAWAGLGREAIDYVNTHGTGTRMNDGVEAQALGRFFGGRLRPLPCSSTKPVTGHCLGATPALEALVCIEALQHQQVPPTANCREPDPGCPIDLVPGGARAASLRHVLSTSHGFWGYHGALLFSRVTPG